MTSIYQWALAYQRHLIGGVAAVVLLMLAAYGWNSYKQGQNRAAQEAFSEAVNLYHASVEDAGDADSQPAGNPPGQQAFATEEERDAAAHEALEKLLANYSGTPMAPWASYYLALLDERAGQSDQARQALDELSRNSWVTEVRNLAAQHLAEQAQQQGRYQEAIDYWTSLLDSAASHFPIQGVILQLARAYEKNGSNQEALEQYRRLQNEWPTGTQARDAGVRIAALESLLEGSSDQPEDSGDSESPPDQPESTPSDR
ncbi:MAG: tetratricopeptide repeat protein [Acidobacteriota bacterium]